MKSETVTYRLWLFFGMFGAHHLYLRRDRHAFVWWCTLGGVFGLGWFREFWRIPDYVADANNDPEYMQKLVRRLQRGRPAFSSHRFAGEMIMGSLAGFAMRLAIPEHLIAGPSSETWAWLPYILVPYAVALGVHTVGNIGREKGALGWALFGSYAVLPIYFLNPWALSYSAVSSAVIFNWRGTEFRRTPSPRRHACHRTLIIFLSCSAYSSLWVSFLYHNAVITTPDGSRSKVKDMLLDYVRTPEWVEVKRVMYRLAWYAFDHGWENIFVDLTDEIYGAVDERMAINVLNLTLVEMLQPEIVTKRCRQMSKDFHPDRQSDSLLKREAEEKFMEIQKVCEKVSRVRARRARRNQRYHT